MRRSFPITDQRVLGEALRWLKEREQSRWGRKMSALKLAGDPMAMAQPNGAPALHAGLLAGFGGFTPNADVQVFVPITCAQTLAPGTAGVDLRDAWSKPKGAQFVFVIAQGPGGGAGSGRKGSTATVCCGGGGGASGNFAWQFFLASDLPDEVLLLVGAGGVGGAAVTANDTSGNAGTTPTNAFYSVFGSTQSASAPRGIILGASCGGAGQGGTAASGSGGAAGSNGTWGGLNGGNASTTGLAGAGGTSSISTPNGMMASSGAAGGGLNSANVHSAGGTGGSKPNVGNIQVLGGTAGGGSGANGINELVANLLQASPNSGAISNPLPAPQGALIVPGSGGGGGGSANSGDAVSGGNGGNGLWGGGGGGGGAATDTTSPQSGAGGNGGDGYLIVASW